MCITACPRCRVPDIIEERGALFAALVGPKRHHPAVGEQRCVNWDDRPVHDRPPCAGLRITGDNGFGRHAAAHDGAVIDGTRCGERFPKTLRAWPVLREAAAVGVAGRVAIATATGQRQNQCQQSSPHDRCQWVHPVAERELVAHWLACGQNCWGEACALVQPRLTKLGCGS